jgi:nitrite reductase (NADH) small subunit
MSQIDYAVEWTDAGSSESVPKQGARVIMTRHGVIALFKTVDDDIFALEDRCPHKQGPLSQGIVHGRSVTCPLHNWIIGLDDGKARAPDQGCVKRFRVLLQDGRIKIDLSAPVAI